MLDTGYSMLDVGYWTLDAEWWLLVTGCCCELWEDKSSQLIADSSKFMDSVDFIGALCVAGRKAPGIPTSAFRFPTCII